MLTREAEFTECKLSALVLGTAGGLVSQTENLTKLLAHFVRPHLFGINVIDPEPVVSVCALISPRPRNPAPTQGCSDTPFFTTPMCRRNTKPAPRTSLDVYFGRNLLAAKLKEVQTLAYKVRLSVRCFTK